MPNHLTRLERLEKAVQESPRPEPEFWKLMKYMSMEELHRFGSVLNRAVEHGNGAVVSRQDRVDVERLLSAAQERQLADWGWEQVKQLDTKSAWGLVFALRQRHDGMFFTSLAYGEVLDLLDITTEELEELVGLVKRAAAVDDLLPHMGLISRVRICARPVDLDTFANLVFRGQMPPGAPDA